MPAPHIGVPGTRHSRGGLGAGVTALAAIAIVFTSLIFPSPRGAHAATLPGLHVSGNQLVDANGKQIVLRGADRAGTEYACVQGWGIFDGPNVTNDDASIPPMRAWGMNGVNVGLNEDCWLGINGVPSAYSGANYRNVIVHYVQTIESNGMYPVIALFWEAPGTSTANDQTAMPDNDHAPAFWQSVANTFKNDPDVILRLKEEPYPAGNTDGTAAWQCWKNGDVQYDTSNTLSPVSTTTNCKEGYKAVGMQSLINIIRGTGATNVIQVPGTQYANSMTHFLDSAYRVSDTLSAPQLMGVVDVYPADSLCGNTTCYDSYYAPVIAQMPFVLGEFGESVNGNVCGTTGMDTLMNWMDAHNSGYFAWTWDTWGTTCADLSLILDYSGTPKSPNGTDYKKHLLSLAGSPSTPTPGLTPTRTPAASPTPTRTPGGSPTPTQTPAAASPTATAAPAPTSTGTASTKLLVYNNTMGAGFTDGAFAYSSKNSCDAGVYYDPACSYAIAYQAWGGTSWGVPNGSMSTSPYTALTYRLNPNGQPISDFGALFTNTSGSVIKEVAISGSMASALSGGWYQITIPIAQLNPSNVTISEIQLKNETGGNLASVHYDDVYLASSASATATPVTPTTTTTPPPTNTPVPTNTPTKRHPKL